MKITNYDPRDWCHICGKRDTPQADIYYPKDAEQDQDNSEHIRVCIVCAQETVEGATGVMPQVV